MPECLATWLRITAMEFQKYSPNVNLSNDLPSTIDVDFFYSVGDTHQNTAG